MNLKVVQISVMVFTFMMGSGASFAFDDGDFQYWNTETASIKINDQWKFNIEEEFRFGDNISDFYYQHTDIGFSYSGLADWLDVGVNYRAILEEKSGDWTWENRPHINATLKTKIHELKVSNRSRLEFRIFRGKEDKPRYRNKTTIKFPVKWTKYALQPYMADEIFYNFDSAKMTRNRIYAGVSSKLTESISGDFYYVLQSNKSSGIWTDTNAFGTKLKVSF